MKFLFGDEDKWDTLVVANIKQLFQQYKLYVEPKCLGFPNTWENLLPFNAYEEQVAATAEKNE